MFFGSGGVMVFLGMVVVAIVAMLFFARLVSKQEH